VQRNRDGAYGLPPLPSTRAEVEGIGAMLYGRRYQGHTHVLERAQESRVKRMSAAGAAGGYRYVHFATHGLLAAEIKGLSEPCLALSLYGDATEDGLLKMSEIFGLQLDADMVILSACNTGVVRGDECTMDGLSGLARAFFYAGTPRLTVTLWSIADEGTPAFMKEYYAQLQQRGEGVSTLAALNAAKRAMLTSTNNAYSHPFYWAPFVLVGEWR
jgi:CHAT domain-containing protein